MPPGVEIREFAVSAEAFLNQYIKVTGIAWDTGGLFGIGAGPIVDTEVVLYIDGKDFGRRKTDSRGYFEFTIPAQNVGAGSHEVKVYIPGFFLRPEYYSPIRIVVVKERIGTPGVATPTEEIELGKILIPLGIAGIGLVGGFLFYKMRKR